MSIFGDNGANDTIEAALKEIQGIPVPTAQSMQVQLQKLVQMGVLTPEQVKSYLAGPSAMGGISTNQIGNQAVIDAMAQLKNISDAGGMDAEEYSDLQNVIQSLNTQEKGQRGAILQGAAERGALTGGETVAAQLEANQSDAANANARAIAANSAAETRALNALTSSGELGSQFETQQFGEAAQKASAADAIAKFNAQQEQETAKWNAANKNTAAAANLSEAQRVSDTNTTAENTNATRNADLIQKEFENRLAKSGAAAGESNTLANLEQGQAGSDASFVGNLIGAGAGAGGTALAAYLKNNNNTTAPVSTGSEGGVVMKDGGIVPGTAKVPGNSPKNDTVPAILSPGEVVIPRTVARNPNATMAFLQRMRAAKGPLTKPHPEDVATVLQALHHVRAGA